MLTGRLTVCCITLFSRELSDNKTSLISVTIPLHPSGLIPDALRLTNSYDDSSGLGLNNFHCLFRRAGKVERLDVFITHREILLPRFNERRPAIAQQHQWTWLNHVCLNLVPNQRKLRHRSHTAANCNETD